MEQPPFDVERKLSEYLFRQLNIINNTLLQLASRISVLENKAYGGIRKTTDQVIGTLGAAYVSIINYQTNSFSDNKNIVVNLLNGTLSFNTPGNYTFIIGLAVVFTQDNNSSRFFNVRLFNTTDNVVASNTTLSYHVGGYLAGTTLSITGTVYIPPGSENKEYIIQIGGGDTFATTVVNDSEFVAMQL
jgi:hypothetical protein